MKKFTVRVELHEVNRNNQYDLLHEEMANRGFTRTIASSDGTEYFLPNAEYNKNGNYTREQVLESAKQAAGLITKNFSILVTESIGRVWHNLKKV